MKLFELTQLLQPQLLQLVESPSLQLLQFLSSGVLVLVTVYCRFLRSWKIYRNYFWIEVKFESFECFLKFSVWKNLNFKTSWKFELLDKLPGEGFFRQACRKLKFSCQNIYLASLLKPRTFLQGRYPMDTLP